MTFNKNAGSGRYLASARDPGRLIHTQPGAAWHPRTNVRNTISTLPTHTRGAGLRVLCRQCCQRCLLLCTCHKHLNTNHSTGPPDSTTCMYLQRMCYQCHNIHTQHAAGEANTQPVWHWPCKGKIVGVKQTAGSSALHRSLKGASCHKQGASSLPETAISCCQAHACHVVERHGQCHTPTRSTPTSTPQLPQLGAQPVFETPR